MENWEKQEWNQKERNKLEETISEWKQGRLALSCYIGDYIDKVIESAKQEERERIVKHLDGIWDNLLPKPMMLAPSEHRALLEDFANDVLRYMDSLHQNNNKQGGE